MTHNWASGQSNFRTSHSHKLEPKPSAACLFFPVSENFNNYVLLFCCKPGGSSEPLNKLRLFLDNRYQPNAKLQTGMFVLKRKTMKICVKVPRLELYKKSKVFRENKLEKYEVQV